MFSSSGKISVNVLVKSVIRTAGGLRLTPESDTLTRRGALDVLLVRSVVESLAVVTRADRRLRQLYEVVCVCQSVLPQ